MSKNIKHDLNELTTAHGIADPVMELSGIVSWNVRYLPLSMQAKAQKAASLLTEAAGILHQLQAEEESERTENASQIRA